VKRRLRQSPLTQPEGVLARQESIAQALAEAVIERALVVVPGVVLQNMLDVCRIRREESMVRAGLEVDELAVSIRGVEKRADRIRPKVREYSKNGIPARSGRKPW
jgi:hypothetical protein